MGLCTTTDLHDVEVRLEDELRPLLPPDVLVYVASQVAWVTIDGLDDPWPSPRPPPTGRARVGAPFGSGTYTIQEGQLADVKNLVLLIIGIVGLKEGDVPQLVISAGWMLWRLNRKGVILTQPQVELLLEIRARSGATQQEILQAMAKRGRSAVGVSETLESLRKVRLNDGTVVSLVHDDAAGRCSTDARGLWEIVIRSIG